ncbi:MAG: metallophosphoesterase, partial [Planctomycetota bacterium]|nr:metallophosphoesterase [Planctomycetota bacterium]
MKIAVTADVHLVAGDNGHPERLAALRDILEQLPTLEIDRLIIAGDLFDRDLQGYGEFETLCNEFPEISIEIIPGNHDPSLVPEHLLAPNITVYSEPQLVDRDGRQLLFVPYAEGTKMGEVIDRFRGELSAGRWILVGHGNYGGGLSTPHPHEPGVYMPLSRRDIDHSEPALVLLGHIHVPTTQPPVHYPGSPCGLDISET